MRSQQQVFQAQGQFTSDINQLKSGLSLNSEFYSYKVTILGNLAQHSAVPLKDGLKAYTGIVYAIASDDANQKVTKLLLCESNIPTKQIPSLFKINTKEYNNGKYANRKQAIAVAYSQINRAYPQCKEKL